MDAEMAIEAKESASIDATLALLRRTLTSGIIPPSLLLPNNQLNHRKLMDTLRNAIVQGCSASMLLIGPRGSGKSLVLDQVLMELQRSYSDRVSTIQLNGLLHFHDRCAMKEIAKQMCMEHTLTFSTMDADQLLEKRVRSRFSHCKFLFLPPSVTDIFSLYERLFLLPVEQNSQQKFGNCVKEKVQAALQQANVKKLVDEFMSIDVSGQRCMDLLFRVLCAVNRESGHLSAANFKLARASLTRQPKLEILSELSVLELCLLVTMFRLEARDAEYYNFNTVFKEYKRLEEHNTCDVYSKQCALRAFEHLLEREVIGYKDNGGFGNMLEIRPVKLLLSSYEIDKGLEANPYCPAFLRQWHTHETLK